jgi:hypothetical protein
MLNPEDLERLVSMEMDHNGLRPLLNPLRERKA